MESTKQRPPGRQPLHPIDKALDEGQRMFELSGGDVAAAMRYAVIQAWAAGWDAGVRQGRDEKQRAARFTETVKAEIEASRRRFADLPERVIDGELAQGDGR